MLEEPELPELPRLSFPLFPPELPPEFPPPPEFPGLSFPRPCARTGAVRRAARASARRAVMNDLTMSKPLYSHGTWGAVAPVTVFAVYWAGRGSLMMARPTALGGTTFG